VSECRGRVPSLLVPKVSECRGRVPSLLAPKVSECRGRVPSFLAQKASECRGRVQSFLAPKASECRGRVPTLGVVALGVALLVGATDCNRARGAPALLTWGGASELGAGVTVREGRSPDAPNWRLVDVAIDLARAELRVVGLGGSGELDQMIPAGTLAAVNGGYFDEHFRPTGWLVDRSTELAPRVARNSGGVLAVRDNAQIWMGPLRELPFPPAFALQNGPRLIEASGKVGIRSDDGKHAARTVACADAARLHLLVVLAWSGEGPTLLETARLLEAAPARGGLGCRAALNLDGGPSTGIWLPATAKIASALPRARIAYGVAVVPRPK
jgi:hypothetical protein